MESIGSLIYAAAALAVCALLFAGYLIGKVRKQDAGTERMKEIAAFIHEGARAFLLAEYRILIFFVAILLLLIGLGIGYKAMLVLLVMSLCSAILSMLPFKFNERIERAVDDTIDHGIEDMRALGRSVSEWNEQHRRHPRKSTVTPPETPPTEPAATASVDAPTPPPLVDPEDPSRFMPK